MAELSRLLTVYELEFLLFRMKVAAQVEDDGQKEHEAGDGDDRNHPFSGGDAVVALTPKPAGHVHLKPNHRTSHLLFCVKYI